MHEPSQQEQGAHTNVSTPVTSAVESARSTQGMPYAPVESVDLTGDCHVALTAPFYLRDGSLTDGATGRLDEAAVRFRRLGLCSSAAS